MKQRVAYLDWLRVISIFAVIVLHVAAQNWYKTDVNGIRWQTFNVYDSLVRWSVPVFVMISGALMLGRNIDIRRLYSRNILRLVTAYFFYNTIYALLLGYKGIKLVSNILIGKFHMWFIPMIIGLYICIPVIDKIIESEKTTEYFLISAIVFTSLIPWIVQLTNNFGSENVKTIISALNDVYKDVNFHFAAGYTGYFVAGRWLNKKELSKKTRKIIYILGIVGIVLTVLLTSALSVNNQKATGTYYGYFSFNVAVTAIAVFVWAKYNIANNNKLDRIINILSKYSFGIYLVHILVMEQLNIRLTLNTMSFHPVISVPVLSAVIFVISAAVSAVISKIPFLNKYIV